MSDYFMLKVQQEIDNLRKALEPADIVRIIELKHSGNSAEKIAESLCIEEWLVKMILFLYE
jgi:hypothetical protein